MSSLNQTFQNSTIFNKPETLLIEAEAYRNGTQGTSIESAIAETDASFERKKELVRLETAETIKKIEGSRNVAQNRRTESENRWQMWRELTGNITPPFASPLGRVMGAFAAITGEAVLLAPLMDLLGVADPDYQYVMAGVIVIFLALLCELPIELWKKSVNRYAVYAVGTAVGLGMIALGVFRAFGLQTIETKKSPLIAEFLGSNSTLTAVVIAFLTAGLPIGAAFAFETGWHGLSRFKQWKKARRDALKFARLEEVLTKKLEAETEKRDRQIAALDEMSAAWRAGQQQAHDEGIRDGAIRKPFWEIAFLLFGGGILILSLVMAFTYIFCDATLGLVIESDLGRFALYLGLAIGCVSVFAFYVLIGWNSPSAKQLYRNRTVVFKNVEYPLLAGKQHKGVDSFKEVVGQNPAAMVGNNGNGQLQI